MTIHLSCKAKIVSFMLGCITALGFAGSQQVLQEKAQAINIEVPTRVFDGGSFVSGLLAGDFELFENGLPQDILACYLVDSGRKEILPGNPTEEVTMLMPDMRRTFILIFETNSFGKGCRDGLTYIVEQVLGKDDTLIVATPLRTYRIGPESPTRADPKALAKALRDKCVDDIDEASGELRFLISDYLSIASKEEDEIAVGREDTLVSLLGRIRQLKSIDEPQLVQLAQSFSRIGGQKHILLFLEKEDVLLKRALSTSQDLGGGELFKMQLMRDVRFDVERLARLFSQNQLDFHFLFLARNDLVETSLDMHPSEWGDFEKADITGELFSVFSKISTATGGLTITSRNPMASIKKAVEVAEKYYVLYYQPKNTIADGSFREIKVRVKGKDYNVIHRKGYFMEKADPKT